VHNLGGGCSLTGGFGVATVREGRGKDLGKIASGSPPSLVSNRKETKRRRVGE
jgi:hypothetical protein